MSDKNYTKLSTWPLQDRKVKLELSNLQDEQMLFQTMNELNGFNVSMEDFLSLNGDVSVYGWQHVVNFAVFEKYNFLLPLMKMSLAKDHYEQLLGSQTRGLKDFVYVYCTMLTLILQKQNPYRRKLGLVQEIIQDALKPSALRDILDEAVQEVDTEKEWTISRNGARKPADDRPATPAAAKTAIPAAAKTATPAAAKPTGKGATTKDAATPTTPAAVKPPRARKKRARKKSSATGSTVSNETMDTNETEVKKFVLNFLKLYKTATEKMKIKSMAEECNLYIDSTHREAFNRWSVFLNAVNLPFQEAFQFKVATRYRCNQTESENPTFNFDMSISLSIENMNPSLSSAVDKYVDWETVADINIFKFPFATPNCTILPEEADKMHKLLREKLRNDLSEQDVKEIESTLRKAERNTFEEVKKYLKDSEKNVTDDEFKKFKDAILEAQNIEKKQIFKFGDYVFFQTNAIESDVENTKVTMQQFNALVSSTQKELKNMNVFAVLMKTGYARAGHFVAYLKCKERDKDIESWYRVDDLEKENGGIKVELEKEINGFPELIFCRNKSIPNKYEDELRNIVNEGNSCYVNAIMQVIAHMSELFS